MDSDAPCGWRSMCTFKVMAGAGYGPTGLMLTRGESLADCGLALAVTVQTGDGSSPTRITEMTPSRPPTPTAQPDFLSTKWSPRIGSGCPVGRGVQVAPLSVVARMTEPGRSGPQLERLVDRLPGEQVEEELWQSARIE